MNKFLKFEEKVKFGSYYTPKKLVKIVEKYILDYIEINSIILDNSAGYGAFANIAPQIPHKKILTDIDPIACSYLKLKNNKAKVFCDNSLLNISRNKYNIKNEEKLIIVGNPPYNDITSKSKHKIKKQNKIICDEDVKSRDLGISFLKSYNKLQANYICVLHPLSYLIKKTNFNCLKDFKDNYKITKGLIFSSNIFKGTKKTEFPIVIALYKKDINGMTYSDILNFKFDILDSTKKLQPKQILTTDNFIRKYPPTKKQNLYSDIGVYFYTFRDINSLKTSKSFIKKNNVVVNLNEFYKYAYLNVFKTYFKPSFIFGNFSPIYEKNILTSKNKFIKSCIIYSLKTNQDLINSLTTINFKKILNYYEISNNDFNNFDLEKEKNNFINYFKKLQKNILKG